MNQIASGGFDKGVISISIGTSGAIRTVVDQVPKLYEGLWCYDLGKGYLLGATIAGAGNVLDFYRERLFKDHSMEEVTKLLEGEKVLESVIYMPFEFGERNPGYCHWGPSGFVNRSDGRPVNIDGFRRTGLMITAMEGVLFNLYQCYLIFDETLRQQGKIRLSGGILRSPVWTGMLADIFGKEIQLEEVEHSSLLGGALLALGQMEYRKSERLIQGDERRSLMYQKRFEDYIRLYEKRGR